MAMEFAQYILDQHDALIATHSRFSFYQGWPRDALVLMCLSTLAWMMFAVGLTRLWIADLVWAVWPLLHAILISTRMSVHLTQKQWLVFATLLFWGLRLALRVVLKRRDVDWRFDDLKQTVGDKWAKLVSLPVLFLGKGFFLYVGCLPLYTLVANDFFLVRPLFVVGLAIQLLGIVVETAADEELDGFAAGASDDAVLNTGLWRYSRHPNYLGECLFWIGLWISSGCELGPGMAGPILMLVHFYLICVPRLEDHILDSSRGPAYAEYVWLVPSGIFPFGRCGKLLRRSSPPAAAAAATATAGTSNVGKNSGTGDDDDDSSEDEQGEEDDDDDQDEKVPDATQVAKPAAVREPETKKKR